jgi:hypothetical protein
MKTSILSFALGLALAGPAAAYTNEGPTRPAHSHRAYHHHFWATGWTQHRPHYATDGLSDHRAACVTYGCVGAGGGGD